MVNGGVVNEAGSRYVDAGGRSAPRIEQLLPQHHEAWVKLIAETIESIVEGSPAALQADP